MASHEMAFRVRSSKFRHVFGSANKKEQCYECMKITKNAHDSNFCAVNPKFLAVVVESAGGGSFVVLNLDQVGRVDVNSPKVCGHSGPVLDIKWNPFNDHIIASSSDDATIKLWQIPEGGLTSNLTEWLVDLHGHTRRVAYIEWHPTAENILLSAGYDFNCILWNTETAEPINIISVHTDTIFSIAWNREGSLFATTSKDKLLRVINPRDGTIVSEGQGHQGSKASKVVFIGDKNRLFTTGFSRMSDREYAVWDGRNLNKALRLEAIDSSSGVLALYYDHDTSIVYIAGKGDGNIRYFEVVDDSPYVHYLSQYQSGSPQRGLGFMPKRGIDPNKCEIFRFYKLHTAKTLCEPISMIVPRKSEMFQDDLYPPTASSCPSLTADEWIAGQNREPILISLKLGELKAQPAKVKSPSSAMKFVKKIIDGALSQTPTITTYKAVKRSASTPSGTPPHHQQQNAPPASKRPQGSSSSTSTTPERVPGSVRNIAKLSTQPDPTTVLSDGGGGGSNRQQESAAEEVENNNNPAHGDGVDVSDRIGMFENKTTITQQTTRLTNTNTAMQVNKKVWTPTYTSTNDVSSHNGSSPKTDPEASPHHPAQTLSPSVLSPSSPTPPSHSPSPHSAVTKQDYVPIFTKFDRSKYQQQQQNQHQPRSVSDLGLGAGSSGALFQQQQQQQKQQQEYLEQQQQKQKQHRSHRKSKTTTVSDISREVQATPPGSPYSTIKRVSVTPPSTLEWTANPLWDSPTKGIKSMKSSSSEQTTHTSTHELKLSSREGTPNLLSPTCPLSVDTTELDQVLTEMDHRADPEFQYVYKKEPDNTSQSPSKRPERPRDFGSSGGQIMQRTLSVDSPEPSTPGHSDHNPDWIIDDAPAPDDTLIKPSQMRESLRRKNKESSPAPKGDNKNPGSSNFQRAGYGRSSAREMSASPSITRRNVSERMSLREKRSWRSAEPEIIDAQKSFPVNAPPSSGSTAATSITTSSNGYQFVAAQQQQQQQQQQKPNRRRQVRKLADPTSSDDETTKHVSRASEPNNNYKASVPLSSGPVNEYPTLYDNYPHPRSKNPSSSAFSPPSSHSSSSKLKESLRKGSSRRNTTDATGDFDNRVHVKKVWQASGAGGGGGGRSTGAATSMSPNSPTSASENGHNMPTTDPERSPKKSPACLLGSPEGASPVQPKLRKAYFRQLEQISSLKEQISVKDKRIRQLEEELKMLRVLGGGGGQEESTC